MSQSEKIIGYILLTVGLIVILVSAYQVFQMFTGNATPLAVVQTTGISMDVSSFAPPGTIPPGTKAQLLSAAELDEFANLTLTYLLLTFLVSVGYKIASLGIQLVKTIEVKVNQKSV